MITLGIWKRLTAAADYDYDYDYEYRQPQEPHDGFPWNQNSKTVISI